FKNRALNLYFKFLGLVSLLIASVAAKSESPIPPSICPSAQELASANYLCFDEEHHLICDGNSAAFKLQSQYNFETLVIRNSPKLPFWGEQISLDHFKVNSLVIQQNSKPEIVDNLEEL